MSAVPICWWRLKASRFRPRPDTGVSPMPLGRLFALMAALTCVEPSFAGAPATSPPLVSQQEADAWSAKFRHWHYWPNHVIPPRPDIPGFPEVAATDCPCVYQLPGDPAWYMSFLSLLQRGSRHTRRAGRRSRHRADYQQARAADTAQGKRMRAEGRRTKTLVPPPSELRPGSSFRPRPSTLCSGEWQTRQDLQQNCLTFAFGGYRFGAARNSDSGGAGVRLAGRSLFRGLNSQPRPNDFVLLQRGLLAWHWH